MIKTSKSTPYLHICKKNVGYFGICTNSEFEPKSKIFFKFDVENYGILPPLKNTIKESFERAELIFRGESTKYYTFFWKRKEAREVAIEKRDFIDRQNSDNYVPDLVKIDKFIEYLQEMWGKLFNIHMAPELKDENFLKTMLKYQAPKYPDFCQNEADLIYENMKKVFDEMKQNYENVCTAIKNENIRREKQSKNNTGEELSKAVNEKFDLYMKENKLIAPYPDKECVDCNKVISYANWSHHLTTAKHKNIKEITKQKNLLSVKIICDCGAKVLPGSMASHLETDKHKGIGQNKILCDCGFEYFQKNAKKHLGSAKHKKKMGMF